MLLWSAQEIVSETLKHISDHKHLNGSYTYLICIWNMMIEIYSLISVYKAIYQETVQLNNFSVVRY